jgi:F-box protein, helicase, 18
LHIPETLLPKDFPASPHILKVKVRESNFDYISQKTADKKQSPAKKKLITKAAPVRANTIIRNREINKDAYKPWTPDQDDELKDFYDNGTSITKMAAHFGRTKGAVISRLKKLNHYFDE